MSPAAQPAAPIRIQGSAAAEVARAATALRAARRVLVTGLRDASSGAVRVACDLAEALDAAIDTGTADLASPLGPVVTRAGAVTAEPAELRDRADLVVAWFCDPETLHPGFQAAFLAPPLRSGQPRQVLAVGPEPRGAAGRHLPLLHESAVDAARLLHAILLGHCEPHDNPAAVAVAHPCQELATAIRAADCVGFVTARAGDPLGLATWAARLLVRAIAHERPAFAVPLDEPSCGQDGNPGAADVLTWRYGAAGGIARADPLGAAFRPGECSAATLLGRGEVDAVLAVGSLPDEVEAAVASRAAELAVVRVDGQDTAAAMLMALLHAVREQSGRERTP